MIRNDELFLHEEVLLLALQDEEGTIPLGTMYPHAAAGAIMAELLLRGRIELDGEDDALVRVVNLEPIGAPLVDAVLADLAGAKRPQTMSDWIMKIALRGDLKEMAIARLCERGILRAEKDKFLLIFTREVYPEVDPEPEDRLVERIREAVLTDRNELDVRTVILISLADQTDLLKAVFSKQELKIRRERIDTLASGQVMGNAMGQVREDVQAAMVATTAAFTASMAAVTAASASCSAATAAC